MEYLEKCSFCAGKITAIDKENNICECTACGYVFDNPRPALMELKEFYSRKEKYVDWLKNLSAREKMWRRRLKIILKFISAGKLLDVGSGIGQFLDVADENFSVVGTEVSDTAIAIAKERYNLNLIKGSLEEIKIDTKTRFDIVTFFHVLEHVPNPNATIKLCENLLKENGILVIAVPNELQSVKSYLKRVLVKSGLKKYRKFGRIGLRKINLYSDLDEIHISHFTQNFLVERLKEAGFIPLFIGLDPYFCVGGLKKVLCFIYYFILIIVRYITKKNFYNTILIIARKAVIPGRMQ